MNRLFPFLCSFDLTSRRFDPSGWKNSFESCGRIHFWNEICWIRVGDVIRDSPIPRRFLKVHSLSLSIYPSLFLSFSFCLSLSLSVPYLSLSPSLISLSLSSPLIHPPLSLSLPRSLCSTSSGSSRVVMGYAVLTNYRVMFLPFSLVVTPLSFTITSIRKLVRKNTSVRDKKAVDRSLELVFVDFRSVSFLFQPKLGARRRFVERLLQRHPGSITDTFAFTLGALIKEKPFSFPDMEGISFTADDGAAGWKLYDLSNEYRRQGIYEERNWRISSLNTDYHICRSYPPLLVVPAEVSDAQVRRPVCKETDFYTLDSFEMFTIFRFFSLSSILFSDGTHCVISIERPYACAVLAPPKEQSLFLSLSLSLLHSWMMHQKMHFSLSLSISCSYSFFSLS
jgi:hypothetical protein